MPDSRGAQTRRERNLERRLQEDRAAEARPDRSEHGGDPGDVAAKLARDAVEREAVRRAAAREGSESPEGADVGSDGARGA